MLLREKTPKKTKSLIIKTKVDYDLCVEVANCLVTIK